VVPAAMATPWGVFSAAGLSRSRSAAALVRGPEMCHFGYDEKAVPKGFPHPPLENNQSESVSQFRIRRERISVA
jgi:hypothetical protein